MSGAFIFSLKWVKFNNSQSRNHKWYTQHQVPSNIRNEIYRGTVLRFEITSSKIRLFLIKHTIFILSIRNPHLSLKRTRLFDNSRWNKTGWTSGKQYRPDQTHRSDLGLLCLIRHVYPNTWDKYRIFTYLRWISSVMKTSVFSRVRSTRENLNVFITRNENIYGIHWKRENCLFYICIL